MVKAMIESPFELVGSIPNDPKFFYRDTKYIYNSNDNNNDNNKNKNNENNILYNNN